jgi:hypothetical protein
MSDTDMIALAVRNVREFLVANDTESADALLEEVEAALVQAHEKRNYHIGSNLLDLFAEESVEINRATLDRERDVERDRCIALVDGYDGTGVPWATVKAELIGLFRGDPPKVDMPEPPCASGCDRDDLTFKGSRITCRKCGMDHGRVIRRARSKQ